MRLLYTLIIVGLLYSSPIRAADSILLTSESGDSLMFHQLKNGEIWASFMLTDQVVESFADHELIVLQIDNNQPINLAGKQSCGGAAGKKQTMSYDFLASDTQVDNWQFSQSTVASSNVLQLLEQDKLTYQKLLSDRRPEVVDFPIQSAVGFASLQQQFQQGQIALFRYTTQANEQRVARFHLKTQATQLTDFFASR